MSAKPTLAGTQRHYHNTVVAAVYTSWEQSGKSRSGDRGLCQGRYRQEQPAHLAAIPGFAGRLVAIGVRGALALALEAVKVVADSQQRGDDADEEDKHAEAEGDADERDVSV